MLGSFGCYNSDVFYFSFVFQSKNIRYDHWLDHFPLRYLFISFLLFFSPLSLCLSKFRSHRNNKYSESFITVFVETLFRYWNGTIVRANFKHSTRSLPREIHTRLPAEMEQCSIFGNYYVTMMKCATKLYFVILSSLIALFKIFCPGLIYLMSTYILYYNIV